MSKHAGTPAMNVWVRAVNEPIGARYEQACMGLVRTYVLGVDKDV
jgi:hypothetical protein